MRHQFWHEKQLIYEWDQSLSDLNIFIRVPEGVKAKQLFVDLSNKHLSVGIKPNPAYLEARPAMQKQAYQQLLFDSKLPWAAIIYGLAQGYMHLTILHAHDSATTSF